MFQKACRNINTARVAHLEDLVGESSFTLGRLPSTIRSPLSVSRQFLNERREFGGDPFLVLLLSLRCPSNYQLLSRSTIGTHSKEFPTLLIIRNHV
jgi:hypothetical protein